MRTTTLQERVSIGALAQAGHSDAEIAERLGWSIWAIRKWRRRGQPEMSGRLASRMGRPRTGALSNFAGPVREALQLWRKDNPGWGPLTLQAQAKLEPTLVGLALPSRASIARWLKETKQNKEYQRHCDLPQPASSATAVHEEWEMDARGHEHIPGVGVITLIDLNDRFSKVKLCSFPGVLGTLRATRHLEFTDYQALLRQTFAEWGLPDRLAVDRDSVFYDNSSKSPFPTHLHLWLLALGVDLLVGPPHQPTKRAITERSHQTWYRQVVQGQTFAGWEDLQLALLKRRDFLNAHLPCATLDDQPPLVAHPEASTARRPYRPEWEQELLDIRRVDAYLSQGRWFRRASNIGSISLGGQVYVVGLKWARHELMITFDAGDRCLVLHDDAGELIQRMPLKGAAVPDLQGVAGLLHGLYAFQIALPCSWQEWLEVRLCETVKVRHNET
jgi:transposase